MINMGANKSIDNMSSADVAISHTHNMIHSGKLFSASVYDTDLDAAEVISISFRTQNTTKLKHASFLPAATLGAVFTLIEGTTVTGGSDVVLYNKYRNCDVTSLIKSIGGTIGSVTINATISSGTTIFEDAVGGGKASGAISYRDENEWLLKANTTYSAKLTSSINDNVATMTLSEYELDSIN